MTKGKGKGKAKSTGNQKGKGKKNAESFPYSEIEEIIEASKKSGKGKRGRPPKKLPAPSVKKGMVRAVVKLDGTGGSGWTPDGRSETPSRYGTRGIKRNYLEMSMGKVDIKQEVLTDEDEGDDEARGDDSDDEDYRSAGRTSRKGVYSVSRELGEYDDDEDDDDEEVVEGNSDDDGEGGQDGSLDDSEQEELDQEENPEAETNEARADRERFTEEFEIQINEEGEDHEAEEEVNVSRSEDEEKEKMFERYSGGRRGRITDSTVKGLRTSNVTSSVPLISKVGIRQVKVGRKNEISELDAVLERKMEKVAENAKGDALRCSLCDDYVVEQFSDLTSHLKTFHHVYEPPRCDVCEMDFDTTETLQAHIDRKHGPIMSRQQGPAVDRRQETVVVSNVASRSPQHQKPKTVFHCGHCARQFVTQQTLGIHIIKFHQKKFSCEDCEFSSDFIDDLNVHCRRDHNKVFVLPCAQCDQTFESTELLKVGCRIIHKNYTVKSSYKEPAYKELFFIPQSLQRNYFTIRL